MKDRRTIKAIVSYALVVVLALLILLKLLDLDKADLSIPFSYYSGDALFEAMTVKSVVDNGWYLHNPYLGYPSGLHMYDYPMTDGLHFFFIKLLALFSSSFGFIMNIHFLLTFLLVALSSLYVFRQHKLSYMASIAGSLLYTFVPYHVLRGEVHFRLTDYYVVPLVVMVILWIYSEQPLFFKPTSGLHLITKDRLLSYKPIAALITGLLIAFSGVYYAFFAIVFLLLAGISASFLQKKLHSFLSALALIFVIVAVSLAMLAPNLIYTYYHGANKDIPTRPWVDSELYGLKITQLVLPIDNHRLPNLALKKQEYNSKAPLNDENGMASLGLIGAIGFFLLISLLFLREFWSSYLPIERLQHVENLNKLNIAAILLATIGGFSVFVARLITPQIRSYNRISIFIAFFSLLAFFLILESLVEKFLKSRAKISYQILFVIILIIGILDQTQPYMAPLYPSSKAQFKNDRDFVKKIEASVPRNSAIFQLPYMRFSEKDMPTHKLSDYDHFRGYLHSKSLRWSYGVMRGRDSDPWHRRLARTLLESKLDLIVKAGFKGIYIDRYGYEDNGAKVFNYLNKALRVKPIISRNRRLAFYSLENYNK